MSGLFDDFRSEFSKPNNTLVQLILINTVVYLAVVVLDIGTQISGSTPVFSAVMRHLYIPAALDELMYRPWTLLTYQFAHRNILHILSNMLFLYWFGRLIDEYLGSRRLVGLYIIGGLAGGLFYLLVYNLVPFFHSKIADAEMLGASAAALSVGVGAATLLPNYTFHLLFFGPVRIKYIVFFFVVLSFAESAGPNAGGNIAHLGGAFMGFVYVKLLQSGTDLGRPIYWVMEGWSNLLKPKPAVKVSSRQRSNAGAPTTTFAATSSAASSISAPDQDEVDTILDKISRSGYESLTREEKQKLFRASQRN